jgi:hypothetical protein
MSKQAKQLKDCKSKKEKDSELALKHFNCKIPFQTIVDYTDKY